MKREYKISWTKSQRARLNSATRKYNNAIRKATKNNPLNAMFLPSEFKYSDLKKSITTARALKNTINRLNRATAKGALEFVTQNDGSITTRYARREFAILRSVRERAKSQKRKTMSKKDQNTFNANSFSADRRNLDDFGSKAINRFIESQWALQNMSRIEKAQRYYTNYKKALYTVFSGYEDYDDKIEEIQEIILKAAEKDFNSLEKAIDEAPSIRFIYDPVERELKFNIIYDYWKRFEKDQDLIYDMQKALPIVTLFK